MKSKIPPIPIEEDTSLLSWHNWFRTIRDKLNTVVQREASNPALTDNNFVWNTAPSELGSAGSKYIILGWVNNKECRVLTGN